MFTFNGNILSIHFSGFDKLEDASHIAVCLGSLSYRLRGVVDTLRNEGINVGVVSVHLYRPFPDQHIVNILKNAKKIIVFEKALSYGYQGALYADIKSALYNEIERPVVQNYILGLGGKDIKTKDLYDTLKNSCTAAKPVNDEPIWIGLEL